MNYLIMSKGGYGFFMVPHLKGHVYFYTPESKLQTIGENLDEIWPNLEVVSDFGSVLTKESKDNLIIIFDDVGLGNTATYLMKQGWKVVGGAAMADKIEDDRVLSMELAKKVMNVPDYIGFKSFADGISFLKTKQKDERWVFKPNDAMVPKDYTVVGKDVPQLITIMETFKSEWAWKEDFILQTYVEGVETDFSAYFNGKEFMQNSLQLYFENKPFMSGDVGPATGGSIAVEVFRPFEGPFADILSKFVPMLKKIGYRGQLSINSKVSEVDKKPYFLEFTPRFGYPTLPMDITLIEDSGKDFTTLINALVNGENPNLFPTNKISTVLEVSTPPYPNDDANHSTRGLTVEWSPKWDQYFFPYFIKYDSKKKKIALTGYSGMFAHVTCADETLDGAVSMTYDTYIASISAKNLQYRTDLGKSVKKRMSKLKEWGLI